MEVEISTNNSEKFIPHPILDDPTKMMRIIANPVYDKLTISRAAQIRMYKPAEYTRKSVQMNITREKPIITPLKAWNIEETMITPSPTNNNQSPSKSVSKRQSLPPFSLPKRSSTTRISSKNPKIFAPSRTSSLHSSTLETDKKPITDSTVRYVHSRYGLEIQRYSSPNWLSIDLLTKDACESDSKTYREMLNKRDEDELSSRSIYTAEYYRQRWEDLLQSYKDGHLTHDDWAKQNYRLYCLKTFYTQACEREQLESDLDQQNQRQKRAECVFNDWREAKNEGNNDRRQSRLNTATTSQHTTQVTSVLSHPPSSLQNNTINRISISSIAENDLEPFSLFRPKHSSKKNSAMPLKTSCMLEEQRWSLKAMLKRVVGLAEPLPPLPKIMNYQRSSLTNVSN